MVHIIRSTHHIIPTSAWGSNHYDNKKEWIKKPHMAWHMIFQNLTFPAQVAELLNMQGKTIQPYIKPDIMGYLTNLEHWEMYNMKCVDLSKLARYERENKKRIDTIIGRIP